MDKEIKSKWTEALRSGRYRQSAGKLVCEKGHCCLGVLTEVYIKENAENGVEVKWGDVVPSAETYLSREVADWAGFSALEMDDRGNDGVDVIICPNCGEDDHPSGEVLHYEKASSINDNYINEPTSRGSFEDIADAIERYL